MPLTNHERSRVTKKCQKACQRCRAMKVKCSGSNPCLRCAKRRRHCHYTVEESRVSVPESYLRELQQRRNSPALYNSSSQSFSPGVPEVNSNPGLTQAEQSRFSHNPLVLVESSFAKGPNGRFWYMGPSSSWSFCRRVLALLGNHVLETNHPPDPWNLDGAAFTLKWRPLAVDETPDITDLPPMDYGLYLVHTAHFYFGVLFYIIDEAAFIRDLHEFYTNPEERVASMRLWFAQYLLIIAFGKSFLAHNQRQNAPPDGHQYAARAISLMPDMSGMHADPLQCIQALTLAAIYFQSIDMRVAAFQHIGYALRVCIIEGIHRHVPEQLNGEEFSRRCKTIFWIVYMLDREFAALIGAPSSIRDEDITVKLFVDGSVDEMTLTQHVRLARLNARILTTVYGVGTDFDGTLIKDTQSIFRNLAELSQDLNDLLKTHFHGSLSRASRAATRLILAYHHCVVLTTRPLVMCALHAHIECSNPQSNHISLSPVVTSLLQCCVESAQTVLQTLRTLADENLIGISISPKFPKCPPYPSNKPTQIEAFLPFQIEDAFASAFLLHIIRVIAPSLAPEDHWLANADSVLDCLINKGNLSAPLRRAELDSLKRVMGPLTSPQHGNNIYAVGNRGQVQPVGENVDAPDAPELDWDTFGVETTIGLEPRELLDLAEQLDFQGVMSYSIP
ncbi:fungal-specific transcription factor domain-containing protein [Aspergillus cavernicola]|uniref:Fungal-specific transcription factor domain-containing protein n=1 Tax=Aspergillus cavernicola TaxID=176166 RepID=A0ABR4IZW7_9EURO